MTEVRDQRSAISKCEKKVMRRLISVLLAALLLALSFSVDAQEAKKIPRIGFLVTPSRSFSSARIEAFRRGLHDLGYIEGKNIAIEYRYAEGKLDRLPQLAAELVGLKVDVIVTSSGQAVLAAKNATRTIPIVFASIQDPVAGGLVDSLAKPGGNATGLSDIAPELGGKRLELLKETVPGISRIAFLWNSGVQAVPASVKETQAAARAMVLQLQSLEVRDSKDFDGVFPAMKHSIEDGTRFFL